MTLTATRPEIAQQPIQKVEHVADLPENIAAEWRNLPHYRAFASEPDADVETSADGTRWSLLTSEGCEREEFRLTGIAVIDADTYVARVQVNGGRTAFYPVRKGTHYCSPHRGLGTKAAAFEWLAENPVTGSTPPEDLAALNPDADDRDFATLSEFVANLDAQPGPRVGDFVTFPDRPGRFCRFSHDHDALGLQTSDDGSFHLGAYGASFSGGLDRIRSRSVLRETGETRPGSVWIWHHGRPAAHNGVTMRVPFRVFTCDQPFHA